MKPKTKRGSHSNAAPVIPGERWRPVKGYEPHYEVSDFGRVRRLTNRFGRPFSAPMILRPGYRTGYPCYVLSRDGEGLRLSAHALVARAFIGPCPDGLEIAHLDGDRDNPRLTNLAYVTHAENLAHMVGHGTRLFGERHPRAVITEDTARRILADRRKGDGPRKLMRRYGLPVNVVNKLIYGKTWRHIQ